MIENADAARTPGLEAVQAKASGSSFYAAMRLMGKAEREAMFAIYAFCRAVDDIADDGHGTRNERLAALDEWREAIAALYAGKPPLLSDFLAEPMRRYGLRKEDFLTVINGMQMDIEEDIRAPSLAMLDLYCDRVASAVGRLSIKVFGMEEEPGFALAHHLGRALQLTNILRDLDEDADMGRLYLPREFLAKAELDGTDSGKAIADSRIDTACRALAAIAHKHYVESEQILAARPTGRLRAPRVMQAVYSNLLGKMQAQGWAPPRERARLGKGELVFIILKHGLG
jgi:squalene synthase HpnD